MAIFDWIMSLPWRSILTVISAFLGILCFFCSFAVEQLPQDYKTKNRFLEIWLCNMKLFTVMLLVAIGIALPLLVHIYFSEPIDPRIFQNFRD